MFGVTAGAGEERPSCRTEGAVAAFQPRQPFFDASKHLLHRIRFGTALVGGSSASYRRNALAAVTLA